MATNSSTNVGIRRNFATFGWRNFETSGSVQYVAEKEGFKFQGTSYHTGDTLPFDVAATSYSASALKDLEQAWNQGAIQPLV